MRNRKDRIQQARQMTQGFGELADNLYGKTLGRSPAPRSRVHRSHLTGVSEDVEQQGWVTAIARPHLCQPPDQYPKDCGDGSEWMCRCSARWRAHGLMLTTAYPESPRRVEAEYGPEVWRYVEGGQLPEEDYRAQEAYYDWRPLGPYFVQLARTFIDNQIAQGTHTPGRLRTWEDLP